MTDSPQPRPGEIPLKQWCYEFAQRHHLTPSAVYMRLSRGTLKYPKVRRVSKRTVWVRAGE